MNFGKKMKKILIIVMITFIIVIFSNYKVWAKIDTSFSINWTAAKQFENLGNGLLGNLQVIGTIASVGALMIIGIRYMLGSAEDKSEQKETLIYYVIGAILVFAISNIVPAIYKIVSDIF